MSSVFLSHSHKDKAFVTRLTQDLRRRGHVVWIDEAEIDVGDSLVEKIREGIDRVDFVAAVISKASIKSKWVSRELDIATNRELRGKKLVVLPILLEDVRLPGFLDGKLFADFRGDLGYKPGLKFLLRSLGRGKTKPSISLAVQRELAALRKAVDRHERDAQRRTALLQLRRSKKFQAEIDAENTEHPEWAHINNAYAFEVMRSPVTVGYLLYSLRKEEYKGQSPLTFALELEQKWPELRAMIEAMADFFDAKRKDVD
jgi:hypothetical protein